MQDMKGYDWHQNGEVSYEGDGEFSPDFLSRKSVDIIEGHNSSTGPLFLYVAFQSAHGPISKPPQKYLDLYKNIRISAHHLNRAATITVRGLSSSCSFLKGACRGLLMLE